MSNILENCIRELTKLLKAQVASNVSFHSQADYIELSPNSNKREEKFPAIIMRGPFMNEDRFYNELDSALEKDFNDFTYKTTNAPKVYDVVYKILIISEGDIEGLNTVSKIITFFAINNQLNINNKIYNIRLVRVPRDDLASNISDLKRFEGRFLIEGVEFDAGSFTGRLVTTVDVEVKNKDRMEGI